MWWPRSPPTVARGLTAAEAARRLAADGPNELVAARPTPWWRRVVRQFNDPLVLLLLVAIAISVAVWWNDGASGAPVDALVIAAIVMLNACIGYWQEARAVEAVAALRRLSAPHASVMRDGAVVKVPARELVVGDLIALAEGDAVGADCRLTKSASLAIAEASLTGESTAVEKSVDTVPESAQIADRSNMVFAGTAIVRGRGEAVVVAIGMASEMGRIADDDRRPTRAGDPPAAADRLAGSLARGRRDRLVGTRDGGDAR